MPSETTWAKAMRDPHLMRLGDFLLHTEKNAGWELGDSDLLEERFQEQPWMNWFKVVFAVNPEMKTKPFIVMSSTRDLADHIECPFFNITGEGVEVFNFTFLTHLNFSTFEIRAISEDARGFLFIYLFVFALLLKRK